MVDKKENDRKRERDTITDDSPRKMCEPRLIGRPLPSNYRVKPLRSEEEPTIHLAKQKRRKKNNSRLENEGKRRVPHGSADETKTKTNKDNDRVFFLQK